MKKFTLAWALAIVALLCMATMAFFSRYFARLGKMSSGILLGTLIFVLFIMLVFCLSRFKQARIPANFKKSSTLEMLFMVLFVAVIVLSVFASNHFFKVFERQDEIKNDVVCQIDQIDDMLKSYDENVRLRTQAYENYLNSLEPGTADYISSGLSEHSKETLLVGFSAKLDYGDINSQVNVWKNEMKSKTEGLGLITLMPRVSEINEMLEDTKDKLVSLDKTTDEGLNGTYWDYPLTMGNNLNDKFMVEPNESLSVWALVCNVVLAFIVLLPYIAAERDGRHNGIIWEMTHDRVTNNNSGVFGYK